MSPFSPAATRAPTCLAASRKAPYASPILFTACCTSTTAVHASGTYNRTRARLARKSLAHAARNVSSSTAVSAADAGRSVAQRGCCGDHGFVGALRILVNSLKDSRTGCALARDVDNEPASVCATRQKIPSLECETDLLQRLIPVPVRQKLY
ncbi:hypothetical protein BJV77DRAFT_997592, partial [Russula vinacea]